jgi:hypothetical protein
MANLVFPVGQYRNFTASPILDGTGPGPRIGADFSWSTSNAAVCGFTAPASPFDPNPPIVATQIGAAVTIKGVAAGNATITLTLAGFTDTVNVTVTANDIATVTGVKIAFSTS